jgi:hypothetical protein
MRKVSIILSLLFAAVTCNVGEAAQSLRPGGITCPGGYGYCASVGQCVPFDYPCAVRAAGRPHSLRCPKGHGYCPSLGECVRLDFLCPLGW